MSDAASVPMFDAELAGRDPYDKRLTDLIGELSTRSDEFGVRWAAHNVKFHRSSTKRFHHPGVGDLTLTFEALDLAADPGQRINIYTAEPGSRSHDALNLLASWITTPIDDDTKGDRRPPRWHLQIPTEPPGITREASRLPDQLGCWPVGTTGNHAGRGASASRRIRCASQSNSPVAVRR